MPKTPKRDLRTATKLFHAMGSPMRLGILCELARGPCGPADLAERLELTRSGLWHHTLHLEMERLLERYREGQKVYYALAPGGQAKMIMRAIGLLE